MYRSKCFLNVVRSSKDWYPFQNIVKDNPIILFGKHKIFRLYLLPWQPWRRVFYNDLWRKPSFCHMSQTARDITILIYTMIFTQISSQQKLAQIDQLIIKLLSLLVLWIFTFNQHNCRDIVFRSSWLSKEENSFWKIYFIINFHYYRIQLTKYTFTSNDRNCKKTLFSSLWWKNLDGKNSWNFARIPHNTCSFIGQNIGWFE